jgi:lysophospholipase
MRSAAIFTTEPQFSQSYSKDISEFWQQGQFSHFFGVNRIRLNYAVFSNAENQDCIVLVPGRSEGYLKYKELSYNLAQQGYNVFILDHRGQGISERILPSPFKGYVADFDHYSDDLHAFIEQVVGKYCQTKPYLLAHSMGGAIAIRYMQRHQDMIKAAVISSPMIAINSGGIPRWLAACLIRFGSQLNQWLSDNPWYFLGQTDFKMSSFADNNLMQSSKRYQTFYELYHSTTEIQLGGVTFHWLAQALKTEKIIFEQLHRLNTPLLVLQASGDSIVDNQRQNLFCQQLNQLQPDSCPGGKPVVIPEAYHELFFEADKYRDQALTHTLAWFKRH